MSLYIYLGSRQMDVSSIAALSTDMSMAQTQNAVSLAVLKKAMDQQGSAALALLSAATQTAPVAASNPSNLGQSVDVFA